MSTLDMMMQHGKSQTINRCPILLLMKLQVLLTQMTNGFAMIALPRPVQTASSIQKCVVASLQLSITVNLYIYFLVNVASDTDTHQVAICQMTDERRVH